MSTKKKIKDQYVLCWLAIILGFAIGTTRTIPVIGSLLVVVGIVALLAIRFNVWYSEDEQNG